MLMPMAVTVRLFRIVLGTLRLIARGADFFLLMTMMILMATLRLRYLELSDFLALHHQLPLTGLCLHLVKVLVRIFHVIPAHLLLLIWLTPTPSKRDVTVFHVLIPLWLMYLHILPVCLIVHHHIIIPKRRCRPVLLMVVILIAALVGLSVLRFLVVVLLLLQLLLLRLLVALMRLWSMLLLLEWDQYLLPIPRGGQGVDHLLVLLLLLLILRGLLMHHLVLGRLWTPDDGRWRWLLWGLSSHVHGAMRGLDQDGLRLMNLLIDWLRDRGWLIMRDCWCGYLGSCGIGVYYLTSRCCSLGNNLRLRCRLHCLIRYLSWLSNNFSMRPRRRHEHLRLRRLMRDWCSHVGLTMRPH
jgi:hypothetical protein